jgi:hypothetical protein
MTGKCREKLIRGKGHKAKAIENLLKGGGSGTLRSRVKESQGCSAAQH